MCASKGRVKIKLTTNKTSVLLINFFLVFSLERIVALNPIFVISSIILFSDIFLPRATLSSLFAKSILNSTILFF